jgi:hypothetical protein
MAGNLKQRTAGFVRWTAAYGKKQWTVLFIYLFIHLFIYSFIHLFIYSFIHLFVYLFLFIYLLIYLIVYIVYIYIHSDKLHSAIFKFANMGRYATSYADL